MNSRYLVKSSSALVKRGIGRTFKDWTHGNFKPNRLVDMSFLYRIDILFNDGIADKHHIIDYPYNWMHENCINQAREIRDFNIKEFRKRGYKVISATIKMVNCSKEH